MKYLFAFGLFALATPASAQMNFNVPGMSDAQKTAMQAMLGPIIQASQQVKLCLQGELGDTAMQRMKDMGTAMNNEIVPLCKAGDITKAHDVAVRYADTDEGRAAMKCGKEIKPLLANPNTATMLGRYAPMATILADGKVPDDVCTGLLAAKAKRAPVSPLTPEPAPAQ